MKLPSIGNSFSQDAHKWLSQIASAYGNEIEAVNLYIGGCSLETHWNNLISEAPYYDLERELRTENIRFRGFAVGYIRCDYLPAGKPFSGDFETYMPYLADLYRAVRQRVPDARYYIHQTWAYESDSTHPGFAAFGNDQTAMHNALADAYHKASETICCKLIPVGEVICYLRKNCAAFDYQNGGLSLNRDGFHLSFLYGRYAAALTWYAFLQNANVGEVKFIPTQDGVSADPAILAQINDAVGKVLGQI